MTVRVSKTFRGGFEAGPSSPDSAKSCPAPNHRNALMRGPPTRRHSAHTSSSGNQCGSFLARLTAEFSPAISASIRQILSMYRGMQCSARLLYEALHIQGSIGPLSIGPLDAFQVRFVTGILSSPTSAGNVHSSRFAAPIAFSHFSAGRVVVAVASNNTLLHRLAWFTSHQDQARPTRGSDPDHHNTTAREIRYAAPSCQPYIGNQPTAMADSQPRLRIRATLRRQQRQACSVDMYHPNRD